MSETTTDEKTAGFSLEERAAMKARAAEIKAEARKGGSKAAKDEASVLEKIAEMAEPDRALAERLHALIAEAAPDLAPKLWYGQPAYARAGKVVCFFRSGQVDKERYSTFGFSTEARLDDESGLWPTSFALTHLSAEGEARIRELLARASG
ncbi:uncharacterized protein DUF1801 [Diaminobutyricimonas aerilata]|uniref:Uncharacterized protein DUF1801 n=1 Tax=Diaminobutyricimonas aerilata TaxID=1162967 RepID=A0A2M9CFE9_9MICO|nr:DUF1801 domain-containing protein [Diaminobutyricimonas aerilata]PJJ70633.1 uncharacterized protein DUF1801 [Diaminobutyricimonas aerilata]